MMTRVVSRSIPARSIVVGRAVALMFRNHVRLVVGALVMTLIVIAFYRPSPVQSVAAPVFLNPPVLQVTGVSNTSISLSWTSIAGATEYQLERSETMSGPFNKRDILAGTTFTDNSVTTRRAYVYRVRAIDSSEDPFLVSEPSKMALGTAIVFQFDVLQGETIDADHIHDVRQAVNAVRRAATLSPLIFAQENLNGLDVHAVDVSDLRSGLDEALTTLNIPVQAYTDATLSTGANGTEVKGVHVEQLQARSTRGVSTSAGPLYLSTSKAVGGEFGAVINLTETPVHLSVLPDKRVLYFTRDMLTNASGQVKQRAGSSDAYIWTPDSGPTTHVPNSVTNLFCSGHSFLPNGDLFVTGGHRSAHFDAAGEAHTNIFNGTSWSAGPVMNNGRWYPYNVTLSSGEPLIMGGSYWTNEGTMGLDPYDPNDPVPASPAPAFADNLVPEVYTPAQGGGLRPMPTPSPARLTPYPFLHLLSNGKVFQAQSGFNGSSVDQLSRLFDPLTPGWSALPSTAFPHATGSSILLPNDVVMMIGGFGNASVPSNGVETMNPLASLPAWNTNIERMKFPRVYHTATLLPDGKVLVAGGVSCQGRINIETYDDGLPICSAGGVLSPELFDPQTGRWTTMNKHAQVRAYHSVAALLPDGRVLVGGGGLPGAVGETTTSGLITNVDDAHARLFGHSNVEIFSPPYLFDANGNPAARPTITSTPPTTVTYGETFFLGTSGAGSEPKVSFVRLPSVTHGTNQDQRLVFAQTVLTAGGIDVTVPASPHELPPGHYMVFVLNGGVPSQAAIIRVQNTTLFPTATAPTTTASGSGNIGEHGVEFSSSASGQITHLRFWKALGEPSSNHVGRIWTASGTLLISVPFTSETASGWQEVILPSPLSITAHTRYRVSYNAQTIVSQTPSAFPHPLTRGPLVTWSARFSSTAGSFPTTVRTSNPFVDVRFK